MPFQAPSGALHLASRRVEQGATLAVHEPWSGERLGQVVLADGAGAADATAAAVFAFSRLRALSAYERKVVLQGISRGIAERADAFGDVIAREAGKPIALARAEVARAVSTFDFASEEATRMVGEVMPLDTTAATRDRPGSAR
jgi:acyl-CoA reductase-like NAD-dependent aldehyde dehydrogenase